MKKKYFILAATAITMMASCADEKFVGEENLLGAGNGEEAISFGSGTPAVTRADATGATAAGLLNRNFVVFGYKTPTTGPVQTVFNNYQANYVANTEHTTTTNSAGWEYVGYKNLTATMTGNTGVAGNTTSGNDQTIKYWDYSATNYKFYAYSLGAGKTGSPNTYANGSTMSTSDSYTLEGDQDQLAACYISELKTIENPDGSTAKEVDLRFLSIKSKIQLGFYETIPGYSVKSLTFYDSSTDDTSDGTPVLFAGTSILPKAGTYTVTFDGDGKPQLAWAAAASEGTQANVAFSSTLSDYSSKDYLEENLSNTYLGRASNAATKTEVKEILPYATGADLTLKVDYVLVSRDGSGETIEAKGATAKIPAAFTQWKPNYKYTYLFKISENSNPLIGEVTGLYPITLDAVVASEQDGSQETITTVAEPSITTYAKASNVLSKDEYVTGSNIYVVVEDGATNPALTVPTNAKLYFVTVESGAAQGITEETVKNALANGTNNTTDKTWTVTDALDKKLVVTDTESSMLTAITQIPAADSPTGVNLSVNGAKFTPAVKYVAVESGKTLTSGVKYYTSVEGAGEFDGNGEIADGTNYFRKAADATGCFVFEYYKDAVNYTQSEADTYNAALDGAVSEGDPVPADYATKVGSAAAGATLTAEEAKLYNAKLPGAVTTSSVKTPADKHYKVIKVVS